MDNQLDIILGPMPAWMRRLAYLEISAKRTPASWFGPVSNWFDEIVDHFADDDDPWPEVPPWG